MSTPLTPAMAGAGSEGFPDVAETSQVQAPLTQLFRDLRTSPGGLTVREAARRLVIYGPNELVRRQGRRWPRQLAAQFTQPLVALLAVAAVLAWVSGTPALSVAVAAVIVLNAGFAFVQELQAEKAVEALAAYLPATAIVTRDGLAYDVPARDIVPGDVLSVSEGDRICADARVIEGHLMLDLSALTGEAAPVSRSAGTAGLVGPLMEAEELIFSGTTCTGGQARAVVTRTGMFTELGRVAALSQSGKTAASPLERQVRKATWLIAVVAVVVGIAFLPIGIAAGLSWTAAIGFAIGLIVANVPEGLLPTITLALAAGVREMARRGAVVKRLSAVETLGAVTVICTDKTGTLTQNRMRVTRLWLPGGEHDVTAADADPRVRVLARTAAACTTAALASSRQPEGSGDPTELALLAFAVELGIGQDEEARRGARRAVFAFDVHRKLMTTVDLEGAAATAHTKGAPESVVPACVAMLTQFSGEVPLDARTRRELQQAIDTYAAQGLRVLAVARRALPARLQDDDDRAEVEKDLTLIGLVALADPPRPGVAEAVRAAHTAGIRIHVITGDYGPTAAQIAREVGIGGRGARIVSGADLEQLGDDALDALLAAGDELVFARAAPEAKLRICESLRARGEVVAMTGDGVNDAPALRHADIGVAMGRSGTDVAREAATMVLTDDNFATIVTAVDAGRRVFDNVRKFVLYIFAHAVPEVIPFLAFALSGGGIPLPLTVLQILAIDLGTETLPALALGREPAEPGQMRRPPRPPTAGVIDRALLVRAWALLGSVSAALVMGGFLYTLHRAGWTPGSPTGPGAPLHHAYLQATTITFAGIVACQIGTAFAARTDAASLRSVGLTSNPLLLWGIGFELVFTAAVIYVPVLQGVFGTAALSAGQLAVVLPFPVLVWGVDELVRWGRRRRVHEDHD